MTTPRIEESKQTKYMRSYYKKNPWAKKYRSSCVNAKRKGLEHEMKIEDFKELWFRDEAWKLEEPSIDRVDNTKGYIKENCRFIEQKENNARENIGRKNTKAQTSAGRNNLLTWKKQQGHIVTM